MKRRKRKLKKVFKNIIFVLVLFIVCCCSYFFVNKNYKKENNVPKVDYVYEILSISDNLFDEKFLIWVRDNYGEKVLLQLLSKLDNDSYSDLFWHEATGDSYIVIQDLYNNAYENRNDLTYIADKKENISIGFAGDVSLADNWSIMPNYKNRNRGIYGILSENVVNYINNLQWFTINSEFAFSTRGKAMAGKQYTFRANPDNIKVYKEMGVDMVNLANNHVYDYGQDAFYDTLSTLKNNNLPYIGAGSNNSEAEAAYYLVINGYKIAFLNATRAEKYILTPEATVGSPGVFRCYNPTKLSQRIKEEKQKSDFVVVIVHWGKETYHTLENVQTETGRIYIDSGADMVIGHHAHVLQGMEFYKGKLIAYNLGNFIFNDELVDTGILRWELTSEGESNFYFYPGIQCGCYTKEVTGNEAIALYNKMTNWSINASFLENGQIVERAN